MTTEDSPERSDNEQAFDAPFAISEDLVQSRQQKLASTSTIDFDGLLAHSPLVLYEDLAKGNGGQAWPAGRTLARYLLRRKKEQLKSSSIVELGAGGGLVGLAVALGCQPEKPVYITDQEPMYNLMQRNIELNHLSDIVTPVIYDWGTPQPKDILGHPDVVLAADCVYFEPAFPLLQQTLQDLIGPNTVCYFCFKKRRRADMHFMKAARKMFAIRDIDDDPDRETYNRENIHLYVGLLNMLDQALTHEIDARFDENPQAEGTAS